MSRRLAPAAAVCLLLVTSAPAQVGGPLPDGAVARPGTAHFHATARAASLAFAPDGKTLATLGNEPFVPDGLRCAAAGGDSVVVWDVDT
jgi:hypothetical protein